MRAKKAHEEDPERFPPPPPQFLNSPPTPSKTAEDKSGTSVAPTGVLPAETKRQGDLVATKSSEGTQSPVGKEQEQPPTQPPLSQPTPPIVPPAPPAAVKDTAGTTVAPSDGSAPTPNPSGTDSTPPNAPPPSSSLDNPSASEPANTQRLAAGVAAAVHSHAAEAAKAPVGVEQGVTSASLQSTLPATPSGRTGKKGAWKNTPHKPRKTLPPDQQRTHCISVRLSDAEYARLTTDMQAQHKKELAAVLREAYFNGHRPLVPQVNLDAWRKLAPTTSNLNQMAIALNIGLVPEDLRPFLVALTAEFHALRAALLGEEGGIK